MSDVDFKRFSENYQQKLFAQWRKCRRILKTGKYISTIGNDRHWICLIIAKVKKILHVIPKKAMIATYVARNYFVREEGIKYKMYYL